MDVVSDVINGGDAGYPTILPRAENSRQLFAAGWRHRMSDITLHSAHQPSFKSEFLCYFIENMRLGHAVLGRAGAVGLHVSARPHEVFAENGAGGGYGFRHG